MKPETGITRIKKGASVIGTPYNPNEIAALTYNIHKLKETPMRNFAITIRWTTKDILDLCPSLSQEEAKAVLLYAKAHHFPHIGINTDFLEYCIETLYPTLYEEWNEEAYRKTQERECFNEWLDEYMPGYESVT